MILANTVYKYVVKRDTVSIINQFQDLNCSMIKIYGFINLIISSVGQKFNQALHIVMKRILGVEW